MLPFKIELVEDQSNIVDGARGECSLNTFREFQMENCDIAGMAKMAGWATLLTLRTVVKIKNYTRCI